MGGVRTLLSRSETVLVPGNLGIIFGLFVAFTATQVWTQFCVVADCGKGLHHQALLPVFGGDSATPTISRTWDSYLDSRRSTCPKEYSCDDDLVPRVGLVTRSKDIDAEHKGKTTKEKVYKQVREKWEQTLNYSAPVWNPERLMAL